MAENSPTINRSPFFKTFNSQRLGNASRRRPTQRELVSANPDPGDLQHYPMLRGMLAQSRPGRPMHHSPMPPVSEATPPQRAQALHHLSQSLANPVPNMQPRHDVPPTPEPPSPSTAAERFQQMNRSLPDGVRFEPLDEETKAALQKLRRAAPAPSPTPSSTSQTPIAPAATPASSAVQMPMPSSIPAPPQMPAETVHQNISAPKPIAGASHAENQMPSPESAALLEKLIQDERNAMLFYQYLSGISPTADFRDNLHGIARDCEVRHSHYQQILQNIHGRAFEAKNTPINTLVDFDKGVEVAILEERRILETMAELIDQLGHKSGSLQNMVNRRMIRLNWLQWALFHQKRE